MCHCSEVLLADDEPFNLISLEGILNLKGVSADKVYNGPDALSKLREEKFMNCIKHHSYKLLIIDMEMPLMSGF
jgi:CheY-like chemotaxis protein